MSREKQIEEMAKVMCGYYGTGKCYDCRYCCDCHVKHEADRLYKAGYRKQSGWISVEERLPSESEYLNRHNDGIDTLKRLTIAYMTDTIEYAIGCYDGYKWVNQLGNKKINDVIAWRPFELYEPSKGGCHE